MKAEDDFKKKQKVSFEDKEGNIHFGIIVDSEHRKGYGGMAYTTYIIKPDNPEAFDGKKEVALPAWRVFPKD